MLSKKKISLLLALLTVLLFNVQVLGAEFEVDAKSAILIDGETGQILVEQNIDEQLPPASITKTMTLLLVVEDLEAGNISLDDEVYVSSRASRQIGSKAWLGEGDTLSLEDMLKAAIIPSANDATVALAEHVAGNKRSFVNRMNQRAEELGLENTYFANSTGLPHYNGQDSHSTARDIAKMSQEIVKYDIIREIGSNRVARIGEDERLIYTTNNFIGHYPGADGLKTGWTTEAGYCLVGSSIQDGQRLISVVLGAESDKDRVDLTKEILNYGFRAFQREDLINQGVEVAEVEVAKGEKEEVTLVTANSFAASLRRGTKDLIEQEVNLFTELEAPVSEGDTAGEVVFSYEGRQIGTVELLVAEDIERAGFFTLLIRWIRDFILGLLN